jgi:hypothetical protein
MSNTPKRPKDTNQLAKAIVGIATGEDDAQPMAVKRVKNPAAVELGRKGGLVGGKARAKRLSDEQRREIARNAANARWKDKDSKSITTIQ